LEFRREGAIVSLKPKQIERLIDALSSAFDPFTLNILVATRVDPRGLAQFTSLLHKLPVQAYELIQSAEAQGFTLDLIEAAREVRPKNNELLALADEVKLTPLSRIPDRGGMERVVRAKNAFKDLFLFRTRLTEIEFEVCRVEVPATHVNGDKGEMGGTGFLVAADVVMTNHHVIETLIHSADGWTSEPGDVKFRFDYKKIGAKVVNEGVVYTLADTWLIDSSPFEELDYALVRLDRKAGDEIVGGWPGTTKAPKRGWMTIKKTGYTFPPGSELLIVQHPRGDPLSIASDTDSIIEMNAQTKRVRYRTNTEPGSSGSPCFNASLELVALHHAGDPAYGQAKFNAGIPIDVIAAQLEERKIDLAGQNA
jgi:V8-like Glu-specific endopeptidase